MHAFNIFTLSELLFYFIILYKGQKERDALSFHYAWLIIATLMFKVHQAGLAFVKGVGVVGNQNQKLPRMKICWFHMPIYYLP